MRSINSTGLALAAVMFGTATGASTVFATILKKRFSVRSLINFWALKRVILTLAPSAVMSARQR